MAVPIPVLLICSLVAVVAGVVLGWLSQRGRIAAQQGSIADLTSENKRLQDEARSAGASSGANEAIVKLERERTERLEQQLKDTANSWQAAEKRATTVETQLAEERVQSLEKLAMLNEARQEMSNQFKLLAGEILEEKSKRFTEQNRENIGQLLLPLREKITEFQSKVEEVQKEGIAGRSELKEQIGQLRTLNERLSLDATNLVSALKGSSKVQGDWGEYILESLLESCGLHNGREYVVQESVRREDGKGVRLDVLVKLPGGRHLIIDSKVSLGDYSEYSSNQSETMRDAALARHLASVRAHLRSLSERNYQSLYGLTSLDFVIMFVPIEPAFMLAIARDPNLWNEAWNKNVLLVSPSTLLFVIRTVAHLWKQEQQTRNVLEIAKRGGDLYDKFVGFVEDLQSVGMRLTQAKNSYDEAYGKLSTGRGNLVRQAELLKGMGVKARKSLPPQLTAEAAEFGEEPTLDVPELTIGQVDGSGSAGPPISSSRD
jgi:DNA recombination protein RmuC